MIIRRATREDLQNLSALAIQVWLNTYATEGVSSVISEFVLAEHAPQKFEMALRDADKFIFVAVQDDFLLGYAKTSLSGKCPVQTTAGIELENLYVQQPFFGKGVGSALLAAAEQNAAVSHNSALWLTVNSRNSRAVAFYEKHGYLRRGITYFELGNGRHENYVYEMRAA